MVTSRVSPLLATRWPGGAPGCDARCPHRCPLGPRQRRNAPAGAWSRALRGRGAGEHGDRRRWWERVEDLLSVAAAVPGLAGILRWARRRRVW